MWAVLRKISYLTSILHITQEKKRLTPGKCTLGIEASAILCEQKRGKGESMGVDVKGIIEPSIRVEDLLELIKERWDADVKWESTHTPDYWRILFQVSEDEKRMLHVFHNYHQNSGLMISLSLWGKGQEIIETIIKTFGGWYCSNDANEEWLYYEGLFYKGGGIPYFYKWGVIQGVITDNNDLSQLIEAMHLWGEKVEVAPRIIGLPERVESK